MVCGVWWCYVMVWCGVVWCAVWGVMRCDVVRWEMLELVTMFDQVYSINNLRSGRKTWFIVTEPRQRFIKILPSNNQPTNNLGPPGSGCFPLIRSCFLVRWGRGKTGETGSVFINTFQLIKTFPSLGISSFRGKIRKISATLSAYS